MSARAAGRPSSGLTAGRRQPGGTRRLWRLEGDAPRTAHKLFEVEVVGNDVGRTGPCELENWKGKEKKHVSSS